MTRICPITNKKSIMGGRYSNRIRATKFNPGGMIRKDVNLQKKTYFIPEIGKTVTLRLSTSAIRNINKNGAYKVLKEAALI